MKPVVLVAEGSAETGWHIRLAGGRVTEISASGKWEHWLRDRVTDAGQPPVQALVLLTDDAAAEEYPLTLTLLPCPVVQMPRLLSLAAFAPGDWCRFAIVDTLAQGRCGIVTRVAAERFSFAEATAADGPKAARAFGFERAICGGVSAGGDFAEVRHVSGEDRFMRGAVQLAIAALESDGVCTSESGGRWMLRLARRDSVDFSVIHTAGAAFGPEEDSLAQLAGGRPVLLAVDTNVMDLYGPAIRDYAATRMTCRGITPVNPREASKAWAQVAAVCGEAKRAGLPRHGIIAGVGGGVTLDIAGLAASLYRRGVGYVRVPTTLLGMVDVAVGIKHAINFCGGKSLLGAFHPPLGVVNDFGFLKTLPRSQLANGLSEIIKLGMVRDRALFEWLEQYGERLLQSHFQEPAQWARPIALRAEYIMMAELQPNLYESELRRLPDFGHTFSGAIEEASDYLVPHGQAVAIDMLLSTIIAAGRGLCPQDVLERLAALYRVLGLLHLPETCTGEVLGRALESARLHRGGQLHLVVPTELGEGCFVEDVNAGESERALEIALEICGATTDGRCVRAGI